MKEYKSLILSHPPAPGFATQLQCTAQNLELTVMNFGGRARWFCLSIRKKKKVDSLWTRSISFVYILDLIVCAAAFLLIAGIRSWQIWQYKGPIMPNRVMVADSRCWRVLFADIWITAYCAKDASWVLLWGLLYIMYYWTLYTHILFKIYNKIILIKYLVMKNGDWGRNSEKTLGVMIFV